jgi:molecular chaperone GrpE (heat shock protein)
MSETSAPKSAKWPFLLADLVLLALAGLIIQRGHYPLEPFELAGIVACAVIGAWCFIQPFLREYDAVVRFAESDSLTTVAQQIHNVEQVAQDIASAQNFLQTAQLESQKATAAAQEIGDRMTAEAKQFAEFMKTANDTEKGHLRLEVEKLRRSENDWLQVAVRMLDHTFALHHAAIRSGQRGLTDQLAQFQFAQRDAARRVGLTAYAAEAGEVFDAQKHHPADGKAPEGPAQVAETTAPGYTFQGRLVRPALVILAKPQAEAASVVEATAASSAETVTQTSVVTESPVVASDEEPRLL